jgi:arylsulfatase A-like enzyme
VNHIDDQVGRVLNRTPRDTIVLFVSDHGEMLGDHQWIRKRSAYEPSARIPFAIRFPGSMGLEQGQVRPELVSLEDVMPTLLDAAGVDAPDDMDGRSLLPMLRGESGWREHLHGECAAVPTVGSGQQYITDDRWKYIWYPGTAQEQLFDLKNDPQELHDLAGDEDYADELSRLRSILIDEIKDRPEGFVQDGELVQLDGPTSPFLPGYEQQPWS